MAAPSLWHIDLFGGLRARRGDTIVQRFRSQRFGHLLAYLALNRQRLHTREELADLLWPDAEVEVGRTNLRTALASLRRDLDTLIVTEGYARVGLDAEAFVTDVERFEQRLRQARRSDLPVPERIAFFREALDLYAGPLLPGCYETWALAERDRLAEAHLAALAQLARLYEAEGDFDQALEVARRGVATDPLREEAQGEVIRLLLRAGEPAAAQRQYDEFAHALDEQLGLEPSEAVRRLLTETTAAPPTPRPAPPPAAGPVQVPTPLTRFFGREDELAFLERALTGGARLVTVTGAGGSGKTRLAIEAAHRVAPHFPRGVHFIPLADLRADRPLAAEILRALGLPPGGDDPLRALAEALAAQPGRRLLVLDNAEHLVAPAATLASALLERVPDLSLLTTSRVLLLCDGEQELPLAPLPTPGEGEPLDDCPSVALFVHRVQAIRPDFLLSERNADAVAQICTRLEGIPLAVELAASRAQMLTPAQILDRLDQRLDFLVSRRRDARERHQTLRAAIDWSYRLLDPALQRFFARLSIFRGGWSLEAAEAVCAEPDALDFLAHLRECSLVLAEESGAVIRFRLLETLREYGAECVPDDERAALTARHREHFLELARAAEPHLTGPEQARWMQRLDADRANLRAALEGCLESPEATVLGLRLGTALLRYWWARGYFTEGRARLSALLACAGDAPAALRAEARIARGMLATAQNDYEAALTDLEEGLAVCRAEERLDGAALALNNLSIIARERGDYDTACLYLEEALTLRRALGDPKGTAGILNNLANVYFNRGDEPRSTKIYLEALAINREVGNLLWMGINLNNLGVNRQGVEDWPQARRYFEEALEIRRQVDDRPGIASSLLSLGGAQFELGDRDAAWGTLQEALRQSVAVGRRSYVTEGIQKLALLHAQRGEWERTVRLFAAAFRIVAEMKFQQTRLLLSRVDACRERARAALGDDAYARAWSEGEALPFDAAVALALE